MSQIPYRGNLSASIFPMTIAKSGRSVINPGADQNFDKRVDPGAAPGSVGIPQIMYCENTLPTPEGYQSVGLKTTGTIDATSGINVLETIRMATEVDETTVTPDVDDLDEGDDLTSWIVSPNDTSGADYRSVTQDATDGNPSPSYLFVYDRNEHLPAFIYKNYNIQDTDSLTLTFDCKIGTDPGTMQAFCKFLNTSTGVGLMLGIVGETSKIVLYSTLGWSVVFGGLTVLAESPITGFTPDIWYTTTITMVKNPDLTWTIQISVEESATSTEVATLVYGMNYTPGGYIGFINETANDSGGPRYSTWYDNIHVQAAAPDVSYTSVTGITNIDVAFRANNTIKWSPGNIDGFDNNNGTLPPGFESPLSQEDLSWTLTKGQCFVCIKNADDSTHIYNVTYDDLGPTLEFTEVTATIAASLGPAFNINNVVGITGSYNYLILLTPDSVIWSSTLSLTDFAPSLVSGAGSERVGNLKGDICFAKEHVAGFFLYTNGNVVFSTYTGNARYPWKFREVANSSGYTYPQQVVGDTNSDLQYGIANSRIVQAIQPQTADLIAQEATNFFERSTSWDTYNPGGDGFEVVSENITYSLLPANEKYRIWLALDRYIILGYYTTETGGQTYFRAAIVFDILQKRYGKINISFNQVLISEHSFYFVHFNGPKQKVIFDINDPDIETISRLLLGKFCLVRDHMIQIQGIVLESGNNAATNELPSYTLQLLPSLNGKTFLAPVIPYVDLTRSTGIQMVYKTRTTAQNFCFLVQGSYDLVGVEMTAVDAGRR